MRLMKFDERLFGCGALMIIAGFVLCSSRELPAQDPPNEDPSVIDVDEERGSAAVQVDVEATAEPDDAEELVPPVPTPEPPSSKNQPVSKQHKQPGELGVRIRDANGVVVRGVIVGAAASKAGIRPGDTIVAMDGQPIRSANDLRDVIDSKRAGDTFSIEVQRNGQTKLLSVVLEPRVGYYDQQPLVGGENGDIYTEALRYRRGRYFRPRYRPDYDGYEHRYRSYYAPGYFGRYYGTRRFGYYDRAWGHGGLRLGPLNIWW